MFLKRAFCAAVLLAFFTFPAHAQQAVTVASCGAAAYAAGIPFALTQDQTGKLCTGASASGATPAGGNIIGTVASTSTNVEQTATPTVAASSHASGSSFGGLQTIAFFRASPTAPAPASPFSGIVNNVGIKWKTGSNLTAVTVYLFNANPTASTCTDATAFSLGAADVGKLITGSPFTLTPTVVGAGATISTSYAQSPISVKNADGTPGVNIYACIVANATVTPAANDLVLKTAGLTD